MIEPTIDWKDDFWKPSNSKNERLRNESLELPLRWRKRRRVVVVPDLFHEQAPDEFIDQVFAVMALTPQHTYQLLSKRPERMREYLRVQYSGNILRAAEILSGLSWADGKTQAGSIRREGSTFTVPNPLPNVWLGVSVEDQRRADERIPLLLDTPAAVRFISAEPLLGPLDVGLWLDRKGESTECPCCLRTKAPIGRSVAPVMSGSLCDVECIGYEEAPRADQLWPGESAREFGYTNEPFIDWVICGGESGPGARPMHPDRARGLRDQCQAAGVPFFFKQWGEYRPPGPKGFNVTVDRVGKKRAGRDLDGREWNEYPE